MHMSVPVVITLVFGAIMFFSLFRGIKPFAREDARKIRFWAAIMLIVSLVTLCTAFHISVVPPQNLHPWILLLKLKAILISSILVLGSIYTFGQPVERGWGC